MTNILPRCRVNVLNVACCEFLDLPTAISKYRNTDLHRVSVKLRNNRQRSNNLYVDTRCSRSLISLVLEEVINYSCPHNNANVIPYG